MISPRQALILFATVIIVHTPASVHATTKKTRGTFSGKYTVKMRPVKVESGNPRFECFTIFPDQWIWKIAQKGSRVTLTAPLTISLRGHVTGPKTFTATYSRSEPADPYEFPDTHSSNDYLEQVFTFTSPTSGTVKETRVLNISLADPEKNFDRTEVVCTEYYTGTFRKK